MRSYKYAAVIVTYNRRELLCKNLDNTLSQTFKVDKVFVINNNSSDDTVVFLNNNYSRELVEIVTLPENIGGAGGFSKGIEYVFQKGYDYAILMDDDGRPMDKYCFENLIKYADDPQKLLFINSLVLCDSNKLTFGLSKFRTKEEVQSYLNKEIIYENAVNPFNGTLISRGLYDEIGIPNKDFFIRGDEVDYLLRAQKAGATVFTVTNSLYYHPASSNIKRVKFFNKNLLLYIESPQKEYYDVRNKVYSFINNGEKKKAKFYYYKAIFRCLLCKCEKIKTLRAIRKGYKNAKKGILGKEDV